MDLLDEEVFAVLLALIIIGSTVSIAILLKPEIPEPFSAIAILDENCKIGFYPSDVFIGDNVTLCIFIANHMGYPAYFRVKYKIASNITLPSREKPSPNETILFFDFLIDNNSNITSRVKVPILLPASMAGKRAVLVFELWRYDVNTDKFVYTGKWVHVYVRVLEVPLSGR